jgi:hypothetical protein
MPLAPYISTGSAREFASTSGLAGILRRARAGGIEVGGVQCPSVLITDLNPLAAAAARLAGLSRQLLDEASRCGRSTSGAGSG